MAEVLSAATIDGLTPSPDGKRLAFRVVRQDPTANRVREQWYSVELTGSRPPSLLGGSREPIWMPQFGIPMDPKAAWLPDGRHLAVLAQAGSRIEVHAVGPSGSDVRIAGGAADVRTFKVDTASGSLSYTTGAPRQLIATRQSSEATGGVHLDPTVITDGLRLTDNYRIGSRRTTVRHVDGNPLLVELDSGPDVQHRTRLPKALVQRAASTAADVRRLNSVVDFGTLSKDGFSFPMSAGGNRITVAAVDAEKESDAPPRFEMLVSRSGMPARPCDATFCRGSAPGLREALIAHSTGELVILGDVDNSGRPVLYGYSADTDKSRIIWNGADQLTTGAVMGSSACPVVADELLCVSASPTRPPELVGIDLTSGRQRILFDPNPSLARRAFPETRAMRWTGPDGDPITGIFVTPPGHPGRRPLVVTSYNCGGFLQGSTAQVTPEFELARHGIASLCLSLAGGGVQRLVRLDKLEPLQLHKYALSALEIAVHDLDQQGLIDPRRVGISGQSFSSNVIAYAISHSHLFAAASMGTGVTIDPNSYYITAPTRGSFRKVAFSIEGLPQPDQDPNQIWKSVSPALNAKEIDAALLIQAPESEYLFGLQLYTSIADMGGAVDMFIYPHGGHMLGEYPAQRLSRATRSVAWFRFWLGGERNLPEIDPGELAHWIAIANERCSATSATADITAASCEARLRRRPAA